MADRSPLKFFALVFALSIPFWIAGAVFGPLAGALPVTALQFVCPLIAAVILVRREDGPGGVTRFLRKVVALGGATRGGWLLLAALVPPAIMVVSYWVMLLLGRELPGLDSPSPAVLLLIMVFLLSAAAEQAGWTAYVLGPLQARWGALGADLIVGVVWAAWHILGWQQAHGSVSWTAGQFLCTVALRVLMGWLYHRAGEVVPVTVVFHAMINVSEFLFPRNGSHFDPVVSGVIATVVAAVVVLLGRPHPRAAGTPQPQCT